MPMPSPLNKKTPLPGIVRIFLLWLGFLAVSSGMGFMLSAGAAGMHPVSLAIPLALIAVCVLPINDFYHRRPRAILTGRIAGGVFAVLTMVLSFLFSTISLAGPAPEGFDQEMWKIVVSQSPALLWHMSMGAAMLATLHLAAFFYLRHSKKVRECLGLPVSDREEMPIGPGCLALLCLVAIVLSWRLLSGLFFQPSPDEVGALPVATALTVPHIVAAAALAAALRKGSPLHTVYRRMAFWLGLALVAAASRAWLAGMISPMLPEHLTWLIALFLYALPNALIASLPLLWWNVASVDKSGDNGWFSNRSAPFSGASALVGELPPPLTMALVFVAYQSLLFAFGGVVPSSLGSIAPFSRDVALLRAFPVGLAMLPFGLYCLYMTLNHPYRGMALCRMFCLAAIALHAVSAIAVLAAGVPVIVGGASVLSEIGLLIFAVMVCYAGLMVMQKIILLPPQGSDEDEPEEDRVVETTEEVEAMEEAVPTQSYLERVAPTLPPWLRQLMPGSDRPLPVWFFFLFCLALVAKWTLPSLIEATALSLSGNPAASPYVAILLMTALTGFCFPAGTLFIMGKNRDPKVFSFLLSIWISVVLLFGIYPAPPGLAFAFLAPEPVILLGMIWYTGESGRFADWFASRPRISDR